LSEALAGKTDLDLLIHPDDKDQFLEIIKKLSFKKVNSPPKKRYAGIEDYLGFDRETGRLCHLHVHYRLILGPKFAKNYWLPIEDFVLGNLEIQDHVKVPARELELLLLIIRSSMKMGPLGIIRYCLHQNQTPFPEDIYREFLFLLQNWSKDRFEQMVEKSDLPLSNSTMVSFASKLKNHELKFTDFLVTRRHVFQSLRPFRLEHPIRTLRSSLSTLSHLVPLISRLWPMPKKRLPEKGKFFALVGADGSGKSTIVDDLEEWLSWKLDVKKIYFGIPKKIWLKVVDGIVRSCRSGPSFFLIKGLARIGAAFGDLVSAQRWVWIARKRLEQYCHGLEFSKKGGVVVADRYPLASFWSMEEPMDGPRIRKEMGETRERMACLEEEYYSKIGLPDMVFVLQAEVEELRKRKANLDFSSHRRKAAAVNGVNAQDHILPVDAGRPYDDVLLEIKQRIWKLI